MRRKMSVALGSGNRGGNVCRLFRRNQRVARGYYSSGYYGW